MVMVMLIPIHCLMRVMLVELMRVKVVWRCVRLLFNGVLAALRSLRGSSGLRSLRWLLEYAVLFRVSMLLLLRLWVRLTMLLALVSVLLLWALLFALTLVLVLLLCHFATWLQERLARMAQLLC
mmetsp:Transcript_68966/g.115114  ORF Transcript_68966/g.115114 Transcript_68966/m.115114 type:complete len:124 (-) Transcript_68966:436-807(-)